MDVAPLISRHGGIATRSQLISYGASGGDITRAVRLGNVRRLRRAHYSTSDAQFEGLVAVRVGGRLGGLSAAASYGLWRGRDPRIHVVVPTNASRLRTDRPPSSRAQLASDLFEAPIVLHWADAAPHTDCWRVELMSSLRQAAEWSDPETAIACLDTAISSGLVSAAEVVRAFEGCSPRARARAFRARRGSDSGLESIVRQRLELLGLQVEQQVTVPGVGRIDMLVGGKVVIEVDGFEFHGGRDAFERDRARDSALLALGRPVIRLSAQRIFNDWTRCVVELTAALARFSGD